MSRTADFVILDIETLGYRPDCIILNTSMLCGTWIDYFGDYSGEYVRDCIKNGVADAHLIAFYKDSLHKIRKRALSINFDIDEQAADGRTTDERVIEFWGKHPEAFKRVTSGRTISYKQAHALFFKYLEKTHYNGERGKTDVFVRAPHFDIPKLENLVNANLPFSHWNVRDVRTVCDMAFPDNLSTGYINVNAPDGSPLMDNFGFVPHDSVDDIARDLIQVHISYAVTKRI